MEEYAGSASKLLGLGFDKLTNPSGTIIGYELPADSPVYTEVETPTGNMRIYRGTTQEMQPLSDLQQQVRDSITAPTESGYAAGIHLTLAKDFVDDLENGESVIVSSPSEQAKGFRNLFTHPEYENPLYLAPSQLENGANIRQAYGGYVGLSDAAESGGKLVEGTPGQYSGVEIRLTKDNVLLPDEYAEMTGTQKELANLQNRVAKGKLSDSLTQQMQDYYNQYADYARSQGKAAIVAPENVWLPSGETQLVVQAGAVMERGGSPYNLWTIGPNKGRFQNIPILENTAPSVIQGHIVPAEVRAVLPYATEEAAQEAQIKPIPTLSPEQSIAGQTPEIPQTVMMAPAESSISSPMQSIASQQYNLYLRNSGLVSPSQAALISASIPASLDQVSNITSSYLNESMPGLPAGSIGTITHSVANSLISELPDALSLNREIPLSSSIDNVLSQNTYLASSLNTEQIQELSDVISQLYLSQVESVNTFPNSPSLIPPNTQGNPSDRKEERKLIPFSGRKYTPSVATMLFPGLNTEGITDINSPLLGIGIRPEPKYLNEESQEELGLRPRRLRSAVVYG